MSLVVDDEVKQVWRDVSKATGNSTRNWLLVQFDDDKALRLAGSGDGGYNELVTNFKQHMIMYAVLKVVAKDVQNSVESLRPKFVFLTFLGDSVPPVVRARQGMWSPEVERQFNGVSIRIESDGSLSRFTKKAIAKELLRVGGAHAPNRFIFGPNDEHAVADLLK